MSTPPSHAQATDPRGRLDGMNILRFAHAYDTGGGVELHLRDLNKGLAARNAFTTVLVHLSKDASPIAPPTETIGESQLVKVPLRATPGSSQAAHGGGHDDANSGRQSVLKAIDRLVPSPGLNRLFARSFLRWRRVPTRPGEAVQAGATTAELIRKYDIKLVVLHTSGGSDASEVISAARAANVPIALIHHFSNDRLGNVSVRQQTANVESIAGASAVGLPAYARAGFTNLSDAVDLEFFRKQNAQPVPVTFPTPVLFAPGRITPDKGQADALQVAINLHQR
ncbi:MAG TPA: hypothetical protein VFJ90_16260, partial [Candidatus Didemnitutus sp.]|nr:hypothetical protein [Candidatus Didemnitutus sp.]